MFHNTRTRLRDDYRVFLLCNVRTLRRGLNRFVVMLLISYGSPAFGNMKNPQCRAVMRVGKHQESYGVVAIQEIANKASFHLILETCTSKPIRSAQQLDRTIEIVLEVVVGRKFCRVGIVK